MHVAIVYESMFGNTRQISEAIADGIGTAALVQCFRVGAISAHQLIDADLLILGAPTHAWSLSRPATRASAADRADRSGGRLVLEPGADGGGIREWLGGPAGLPPRAAVFDTRRDVRALFSGRAGRTMGRLLSKRGTHLVGRPVSFLVDDQNVLVAGQLDLARRWGRELAGSLQPVSLRGHSDDLL